MTRQNFVATQQEFATALLDAAIAVPDGLTAHSGVRVEKRFAVYRNNVVVGLVAALRTRFPAVSRIVGEEFFSAMARVFAVTHPPSSPVMMVYGDGFADFIATFAPAASVPYLADVARIEAARTRAYHAADAMPLEIAAIAAIEESALAQSRLTLHPSLEIVRCAYPAVTIWAMNSGEAELAPVRDWGGEDAAVARPHRSVGVHRLRPGGAAFLGALQAGCDLGRAANIALAQAGEFAPTQNLADLFGCGFVCGVGRMHSTETDVS